MRKRAARNNPQYFTERFQRHKKSEDPGPGKYKAVSLADRLTKKPWGKKGVFGSTAKRFTKKSIVGGESKEAPGPGAYKPEKAVTTLDNKNNFSIKKGSSMFLSTSVREPNRAKKNKNLSPPPGSYNVEFNTISENVRRKVESGLGNPLLSSLKAKMKLIAPFNSCSDRFKGPTTKDHERFLGPGYYEFKAFVDSQKPSSTISKFMSNEGRFKDQPGAGARARADPGPGKYQPDREDPWNKKTYNITYPD